eukprot:PhF_6_TR25757/c0_g1_i4/m.36321
MSRALLVVATPLQTTSHKVVLLNEGADEEKRVHSREDKPKSCGLISIQQDNDSPVDSPSIHSMIQSNSEVKIDPLHSPRLKIDNNTNKKSLPFRYSTLPYVNQRHGVRDDFCVTYKSLSQRSCHTNNKHRAPVVENDSVTNTDEWVHKVHFDMHEYVKRRDPKTPGVKGLFTVNGSYVFNLL